MIIGILLFLSSYKKINNKIFYILTLIFSIIKADWKMEIENIIFQIINILLIMLLPLIMKKIKRFNSLLSVNCILIYSVIIDIICYFLFKIWNYDIGIIQYIGSGLVFNLKSILIPIIINIFLCVRWEKNENTFISVR